MNKNDSSRRGFLKASCVVAAASSLRLQPSLAAGDTSSPVIPSMEHATHSGRALLRADLSRALDVRCLSKRVYDERVIDDMEQDGRWTASGVVTLSHTTERYRKGTRSMRFHTLLRNEEYIRQARNENGSFAGRDVSFDGTPFSASARLGFASPQDWSGFNRISLWCYRHPNGNPVCSLMVGFVSQGATAGPADPMALHYFADIKAGEWTRLTWEISEMQRDRVVELVLFQTVAGVPPLPGVAPDVTYDLDQLTLERVDVEPVQGWAVTPGRIAYSHIGYQPGAVKIAICADSSAREFSLLDADSDKSIARFAVRRAANDRGRYLILDFTSHVKPGRYRLQCGDTKSEAFAIDAAVWQQLFDTTLNAFYGFRCGCDIPGFHEPCHLDTTVSYKGEQRTVAGGWHDAANLTQGPGRTHLSVYALLRVYEQLAKQPSESARAARVLEEAHWGLDWSLRLRFGPGLRCLYGSSSYWTDSKTGTSDDVVQENVGRDDFQSTLAVLATATWARVCGKRDPALAARARSAAEEDYGDVVSRIKGPPQPQPVGINQGSWRDQAGYLTMAAVELYRITAKPSYREDALRFGRWLLETQEQRFVGDSRITGFFYEDAGRTRIVHEFHNGFEECGLLALQSLCDAFPQSPEWMSWYAGALLYSEYFCRQGAAASAPFDKIPAAVWRIEDLDQPPAEDRLGRSLAEHASPVFPTPPTEALTRSQMLQMFEAGAKLSSTARLRMFPLWHNHVQHGASVVHLGKSAGLASAAQLRGSCELAELAARQVQWLVGANPFSRSIVYGVGYDFWQNFTVSMPNLVGGMSLGFNCYGDDAPAWGNNAVFPYREQWIFSACRLAINAAHIGMNARVQGHAAAPLVLQEQRTAAKVEVKPGRFSVLLPGGRYSARCGDCDWQLDLVDGREYRLSFDPSSAIDMNLATTTDSEGAVTLTAGLRGRGKHAIVLRLFNCSVDNPRRPVDLKPGHGASLQWQLRIEDPLKPWAVVAIPDDAMDARREAFGHTGNRAELS